MQSEKCDKRKQIPKTPHIEYERKNTSRPIRKQIAENTSFGKRQHERHARKQIPRKEQDLFLNLKQVATKKQNVPLKEDKSTGIVNH